MLSPILALLASFTIATLLSLIGAYFAGMSGSVAGMAMGILLAFLLMARQAGR